MAFSSEHDAQGRQEKSSVISTGRIQEPPTPAARRRTKKRVVHRLLTRLHDDARLELSAAEKAEELRGATWLGGLAYRKWDVLDPDAEASDHRIALFGLLLSQGEHHAATAFRDRNAARVDLDVYKRNSRPDPDVLADLEKKSADATRVWNAWVESNPETYKAVVQDADRAITSARVVIVRGQRFPVGVRKRKQEDFDNLRRELGKGFITGKNRDGEDYNRAGAVRTWEKSLRHHRARQSDGPAPEWPALKNPERTQTGPEG